MVSILPYSLGEDVANGNIDFAVDTFKVMILTATYTPSQAHAKRSDLSNEVSGTGYTAAGFAITVASVARASGVTSVTFDIATLAGPVSGFTGRYAWIYKSRGGADTADELVAMIDHGSGVAADGGAYRVTPSSALTITVP